MNMKKILLSVILGFSCSAYAANTATTLQQAAKLLDDHQSDKAYQLLKENYDGNQVGNQELFLLGMAAKKSGDTEAAKDYFEQLLARDPSAARVKLELAETVFQQGDSQYARNLLVDVRNMNPPQGVLQNINGFIQQIDHPSSARSLSNKRVQWNVWGELGFMVDSNANAAPTIDTVTMYNIPFTLSDDAKETNDTAKVVKLGLSNVIRINNRASWQTHLMAQWQDYQKLSQLDSLQLSLQTGPYIALSPKVTLNIPITTNRIKIGHEQSYYYYSYAIAPRLSYRVSPKLILNTAVTLANRKYRSDKPNVHIATLLPSLKYSLSSKDTIDLGFTVGQEKSNNDFDSNRSLGTFVNYQHIFNDDFYLSLSLGYQGQFYDAKEVAFTRKRKDKLFNASISATKHIKAINADLSLSISHSKNNSNLPLYGYQRTQMYFGIHKSF